jgi:hypothetical protein
MHDSWIMMPTSEISSSHPAEILYQDGAQSQTDRPKSISISVFKFVADRFKVILGASVGSSLKLGAASHTNILETQAPKFTKHVIKPSIH